MTQGDSTSDATSNSAGPEGGRVGIVVIGRNEGERLRRCLASIQGLSTATVYVDSGSTDGSQELARNTGATVVELDHDVPFTAARARNAGFEALVRDHSAVEFVQFVDGDCEIASGWIDRAAARLREEPVTAVVCGRRRETDPDASVYNRLCDMEWDTPVGEALACGGDSMMRARAFRDVKGFDPGLIAGEEPELCLRLRHAGWRIERMDAEMTRHDAAMNRFSQWWRRAVRAGYASAEGIAMYGRSYPRVRGTLSAPFWAVVVPGGALLATAILAVAAPRWVWLPVAVALVGYAALLVRISRSQRNLVDQRAHALVYAYFCLLGKWAETQGMLTYAWRRVRGAEKRLIEYKQ